MNLLSIGSTIKKTLFGVYRALRVDDDGYVQIVQPTSGSFTIEGDVAHDDAKSSSNPLKQGFVARNTLPSAVSENDMAEAISDLYGRLRTIDAAFDATSVANRVDVNNPDSSLNEGAAIADVTNGVSVTGAGTTYDYYFSPELYGATYLSWRLDGGSGGTGITMKFYMTAQDDGTAAASCDYDDITNDLVGAATITAAAGGSNDDYLVDNGHIMANAKYVHVEVVVSATTGTADWTIFKRQRYI